MHTKHLIAFLYALIWGTVSVFAQGNKLILPDVTVAQGRSMDLPIQMDNTMDVVGVQFTLYVPDGISLQPETAVLTDRADGHELVFRQMAPNRYKALIHSAQNKPILGRTGNLMTVRLNASGEVLEGSELKFVLNDVALAAADGSNVLTDYYAGKIVVTKSADLKVSNVTIQAESVNPGETLNVAWTVDNIGTQATLAGWKEQIFLEADNGTSKLISTLYYKQALEAGASVSRSAELQMPAYLPIHGKASVRVRVTADSDAGEPSWMQANNELVSTSQVQVGRVLMMSPDRAHAEEKAQVLRFQLVRSGNMQDEEKFELTACDDKRLLLPPSVTIPKRQTSVYFYANIVPNGAIDADSLLTFTVSGNNYQPIEGTIVLEDDVYPDLTLSAETDQVTEGEKMVLTVSTPSAQGQDIDVNLTCDQPSHFTWAGPIRIPAGKTSVDVVVEAKEDDVPDVEQIVTFKVAAPRHNTRSYLVRLIDNDVPNLEMELSPKSVSEGDGPLCVSARLRRTDKKDKKVTIRFSDDSQGKIYYGRSTVELNPGEEELTVNLGPIDNDMVDGERIVNISAAVYIASCSCNASAGTSGGVVSVPLTIYDNDGPVLSLSSPLSVLKEGGETEMKVRRNTDTGTELVVSLSSEQKDYFDFPAMVTIPAGKAEAGFVVRSKGNEVTDDSFTAMITAAADGYAKGNLYFAVSDQTLPDAQILRFEMDGHEAVVGEVQTATLVVANKGSYPLPEQTKVRVFTDASSEALSTIYLQQPLAVGDSVVLTRELTMPSGIGTYRLYAVVNDERTAKELLYTNNSSSIWEVATKSPFSTELSVEETSYQRGDSVLLSGRINGKDVAEKEVEVYVINSGYRHAMKVKTAKDGSFSIYYKPFDGQMGHFVAGACYVGENLKDEMASFDFYGFRLMSTKAVTCEALMGENFTGSIAIENPGVLSLTGVKASVVSKPEHCEVSLDMPASILGESTALLGYTIVPTGVSEGVEWEKIIINLETNEGPSVQTTLYYYCRNPKGQLRASTSRIQTTMTKDNARDYMFQITNIGKGETGTVTVELPKWMKYVTPKEMASIASGDTCTVIVRLSPTEDMQLNVPVTGQIGVNCANGDGLAIPYSIEPVSETTGTLVVDVCDEYTYYTVEAPHVQGARVEVYYPTSGALITEGVTGDDGLFTVELPEGYYMVNVRADKHDSFRNNVLVDPGTEKKVTVNLSCQAITVDWKVEETEVEDEYSIVTKVKFETNVPEPVVELSMPSSIPAKELAEGESLVFYATLTNRGLITAEDVEFYLPEGFTALKFEALSHTEPFTLAPQQSVLIPVKVTHVSPAPASNAPKRVRPIDDDPCVGHPGTLYYWDCGNDRKWHRYGIGLQLGSCDSNDSSTWDNSGNGSWNGSGGAGGSLGRPIGGGGGSSYFGTGTYDHISGYEDDGCEPCQNRLLMKLAKCGVNHIPILEDVWEIIGWVTDPKKSAKEKAEEMLDDWIAEKIPVYGWVKKIKGYKEIYEDCLKPFFEPCDLEGPEKAPAKLSEGRTSGYPSYVEEYQQNLSVLVQGADGKVAMVQEFFGDERWLYSNVDQLRRFMLAFKTYTTGKITLDELLKVTPDDIPYSMVSKFVERWNNTIEEKEDENVINFDKYTEYIQFVDNANELIARSGCDSFNEYFERIHDDFMERLDGFNQSVCASITLQLSQQIVMTRQAFRGTLTVFNGNETTAMSDVRLSLEVKDENGNIATSHEFQINPETLDGFEGELNFTDGWTLDAQQTGVATVLFIPTKYAAPEADVRYSFGGSLSYVDPFTGMEVTRNLAPVTLTVKPSPNLNLTYFMQRNVLGDDPLTEPVEPSEEAEFSLLIHNTGYGDATKVRMVTDQPEIVQNDKGLLVDFELMSSQLNGGEKNLALGGSVATDFGNIPAQSTSYAQWWIKSSLLGHFTDYEVEATHVTSYDNPDLSLLGDVTIHELIRSLDVDAVNGTAVGFLTNDEVDADDTPDMLYLSNGLVEKVGAALSAEMEKVSESVYKLTVTPQFSGWVYGNIKDPTYGVSQIKSVVRQRDGKEMSLRNFWQTDRTLRDGKEPLYENRIHFADNFQMQSAESYLLTFDPVPDVLLQVDDFEGVPEELSFEPLPSLNVRFNKEIDATTFTSDDVTVMVQGAKQDVSLLGISTRDNRTFTLDLNKINETSDNGFYSVSVQTAGITDCEGFHGKVGKSASWIMFRDGYVKMLLSSYPLNAGDVVREEVKDAPMKAPAVDETPAGKAKYGSNVILTAVPREGYEFAYWTLNGEKYSETSRVECKAIDNMDMKAHFVLKQLPVLVSYDDQKGVVSGIPDGVYAYGTTVELNASPAADHAFVCWMVNGEKAGTAPTLQVTVKEALNIEARFQRTVFEQRMILLKGWNWISFYVNEPVPVSNFLGITNHIVSQFDEIINDPVYGMIGGIESLVPCVAYKMDVAYSVIKSFKGHLHDLANTPIVLHAGWNWVSYPYAEERDINDVLSNASEGDYITSQFGFSEYIDGYWEGTLNRLIPGYGYIYKSGANKTLEFDFSNSPSIAKVTRANSYNEEPYVGEVDAHKYPSTMNVIARISTEGYNVAAEQCRIYAFAGNELRGESRCVGDNHYLTIYGDNATTITFVVENRTNGDIFFAKETVTFDSGVLGSRKAPFTVTVAETTSISDTTDSSRKMKVYSLEGVLIDPDATAESLKKLSRGIYIIDGQKFIVK